MNRTASGPQAQPLDRVLSLVQDAHPTGTAADQYAARCPGHPDKGRHLSIGVGTDGRVLLTCHRGCTLDAILQALGLNKKDLFPASTAPPPNGKPQGPTNGRPGPGSGFGTGGKPGQYVRQFTPERRRELAAALGLPESALDAMPIGYDPKDPDGPCWLFAECDGAEHIIGLVRRYKDGAKKSMPGSKRGLALVKKWMDRVIDAGIILLPEGHSDVLTLTAMGLPAAGRPSNTGGVDLVATLLGRLPEDKRPRVIVVGENDAKPDGTWPGRECITVAGKLKGMLGDPWDIGYAFSPGKAKDIRAWFLDQKPDLTSTDELLALGKTLRHELEAGSYPVKAESKPADRPWPEPRPIRDEQLPVPSIHPAMIPTPFRAWLTDTAERVSCSLDFPTIGAVLSIATIVGRRVGIRPKRHDDWTVVPNLWGGIVGRPGILKTPALEEAVRPLHRLAKEARERHAEALKSYGIELTIAKAQKSGIEQRIKAATAKKAKNSGGQAAENLEDLKAELKDLKEPDKPTERRYVTNDPTIEKLGELLRDNPAGILVFRDELVGFLRNLDKAGRENDRSFYLEAWNGTGSYTYDRIGRGTIDIEAACVSVLGGIQPGPLSHYLREAARGGARDDGLVSRFQLLAYPDPPKRWINVDRWPDTAAKNRAYAVIRKLAELDPARVGAERDQDDPEGIPFLRFQPDAQQLFHQWRGDLEVKLIAGDEGSLMECHLSKYRSLMPSLALLFHLIDLVDTDSSGPVSLHAAEMAAGWCDYLEQHARRIYHLVESDTYAARALAGRINQGSVPNPSTVREISRHHWSGLDTPVDVERAASALEDFGWVRLETVSTGGRPQDRVWINPRVAPAGGAP